MTPARTYPDRRDGVRLMVVDPAARRFREAPMSDLAAQLAPGDLLVVNDAATLPASLRGHDAQGRPVEVRLVAAVTPPVFRAALLGAGDWRARTEDRPPPPPVAAGDRLMFGTGGALGARVVAVSALSPRLVDVRFETRDLDELWAALYREGRPVQYSHLAHDLPLWAVQNVYASRPWAFEMPSAGRPLSWEVMLAARRRGVRFAPLTHAAGLSATGDPAIDAALPLPERYEIPPATVDAIAATRARGGRVLAVGTTVVRALEGAALSGGGRLRPGPGVTDLRIGPGFHPRVVDGLLTNIHGPDESHFAVLAAFAPAPLLEMALGQAAIRGFTYHELGDAMLVAPSERDWRAAEARRARSTPAPAPSGPAPRLAAAAPGR